MDALKKEVLVKRYLSFLRRAEKQDVSWKKAALLVGGEKRLQRLIEEGRIRSSKPDGAPNTKWVINLADVVENARVSAELTRFPLDDPRMRPTLATYGIS